MIGSRSHWVLLALALSAGCTPLAQTSAQTIGGLPVKSPTDEGYTEVADHGVRNLYSIQQLHSAITDGNSRGLDFDLAGTTDVLADGARIAPRSVYGVVSIGPYPFEAAETRYAYKRFRRSAAVEQGRAVLPIQYLLEQSHNSEGWTDRGRIAVRLDLRLAAPGPDVALGMYDLFVNFRKVNGRFVRQPGLIEGPFVNMVTSDDPSQVVISFRTAEPTTAQVVLDAPEAREFADRGPTREHEIAISDLQPDTEYRYHVTLGPVITKQYRFKTAPPAGEGEAVFAYTGDSREGVGGGESTFMGLNHQILERLAAFAYGKGAEFFLQGGDLVNGYTTREADFRTQLYAWKQTLSGFWHERPVYTAMGNHEALLRAFENNSGDKAVTMDRWPYATQSAEAVFADELVQPRNGPKTSDQRRPTYSENVFTLRYGPVMVICYNNNYWVSYASPEFGGSPEGYIMADQLRWIKRQLREATNDRTVRYVLLMAQEPVFPCGGHVKDAMWYKGNNNIRACTHTGARIRPEAKGIIDVRNEFAQAVSECSKVAAVLGSDEHAYYRVLISDEVPIGVPDLDDSNGNGIIGEAAANETVSPLRSLKHATWYITSGGGGAPYYAEQPTPWNTYWRSTRPASFRFSSQENILIFTATQAKIGVDVYNRNGELIDGIADLMSVK